MIQKWERLKFLTDHPELRREDQIAYEQDGEPVTAHQEYVEDFEEARNFMAGLVTSALLRWDIDFFRDMAKEMTKVSKQKTQWPETMRVELLKAAYKSEPVNLSEIARSLEKHFSTRDLDNLTRQLRRLAKRLNVRALPAGRPKK